MIRLNHGQRSVSLLNTDYLVGSKIKWQFMPSDGIHEAEVMSSDFLTLKVKMGDNEFRIFKSMVVS